MRVLPFFRSARPSTPRWRHAGAALALLSGLFVPIAGAAQPMVLGERIIDGDGVPGLPPVLEFPFGIAVDAAGNAYVTGLDSDNVFEITSAGVITEILDVTGAGLGAPLADPSEIDVDAGGNVYVVGEASDNAFRITAGGVITEIIDPLGDGSGSLLEFPSDIVADASGNAYVSSRDNANVFRIDATDTVALVIDAAGAGPGASLSIPNALAVDAAGNLYVAGGLSRNVLQRRPDGTIVEIIGPDGDGLGNPMGAANALAIGPTGDVYVAARDALPGGDYSVWVWRAATDVVEKLPIDSFAMSHLAIGSGGEIFAVSSTGVDEYTPSGVFLRKRLPPNNSMDLTYLGPWGLDIDGSDGLYTTGRWSDSGIRLLALPEPGLAVGAAIGAAGLAMRRRPRRNR